MSESGQHALVTGGSSGIGLGIAVALAKEGKRVTILGRDRTRLVAAVSAIDRQGGASVAAEAADVTDVPSLQTAVERARRRNGPIAILVNAAGSAESKPIAEADSENVRRMIDVNLVSVFSAIGQVLPDMIGREGGRIVNIASVAGVKGYPYVSAYCAAKHGVIGLTRALALELVSKSVTVNAVCPGYTDTDLVTRQVDHLVERTGQSRERIVDKLAAPMGLGRLINVDEVASVVTWLVGPCSGSITGQSIMVAGCEHMAG